MKALRLTRLDCVLDTYNTLEAIDVPIGRMNGRHFFRDWGSGDPLNLIPVNEHLSILEAAAEAAGSPVFGLDVGKNSGLDHETVLGRRILNAPTLYDAVQRFCLSMPWYTSSARLWFHETGDRLWLCRGQQKGTERQLQLQEQRVVMRMIEFIRMFAGAAWMPAAIHVTAGPRPRLEDTEMLAGVPIAYRRPFTAIAVPRCLMSLPLSGALPRNPGAPGSVDREFLASAPARSFAGSLEQVIQSLLMVNGSRIEDVAAMVGCSVRSLQRQLAGEGVRYSELVMRARYDLATRRLVADDGTMIDIALDLGYADQSHFSRAFRRWAGMSPREFRRHYRRNPRLAAENRRAAPPGARVPSAAGFGGGHRGRP